MLTHQIVLTAIDNFIRFYIEIMPYLYEALWRFDTINLQRFYSNILCLDLFLEICYHFTKIILNFFKDSQRFN